MSSSKRRHGKWNRGAPKTQEQIDRVKRKGRTYIPTREEMNEINEPQRAAAYAKLHPPKVRKKRR